MQLARARACDDGADLLAGELADVAAQPGAIEREVFLNGVTENAMTPPRRARSCAELCGCERHVRKVEG
jgi:hypothetical protein